MNITYTDTENCLSKWGKFWEKAQIWHFSQAEIINLYYVLLDYDTAEPSKERI